jgi:MoaA/NifB/PqqE/SkfB family radical SAM enzyme
MWFNHYERGELVLDIELTTNCNAKCPQCTRTDTNNNLNKMSWLKLNQVSAKTFKDWFTKPEISKIKQFHFSGTYGDPGMCKDLLLIVEYIINNSMANISINTNGGMRDTDFWFDLGAIGQRRLTLIFDVDGVNQEMHEFYRRGVKLEKVLENMEAAAMTPVGIEVLTVLFKHNENYVDAIQKMCYDLGARSFDTVEGNNFKDGPIYKFNNENGDPEHLEQIVKTERKQDATRLSRRVRDHRHEADKKHIKCVAAHSANLKVNSYGQITPCCYVSTALGWATGIRNTKADGYITTTGQHGDELNPLMLDYVNRHEDFTLGQTPLETILKDKWFSEKLKQSFKADPAFACKKVCSI